MKNSLEGIKKNIKVVFRTGLFHIFGSSILNKMIAFMSSVVLVRILTKIEYGAFTYAWNIYSIILLVNGIGLESGVLQVCSEYGGDSNYCESVLRYSCKVGFWCEGIIALILLSIGKFVPLQIAEANAVLCLLCLLPALQYIYGLILSAMRSQRRNQDYAGLTLTNTAVVFGVSAVAAVLFREKGLVLGYYIAYAVSALWGISKLGYRKKEEKEFFLETAEKKNLLSISLVSMCNNGLSQLLYLIGVFILGLIDPDEVILAGYKVATLIPTALTFIPTSLVIYIYPYFAQHRNDGRWCLERYKQVMLGLGVANALISISMMIFAPFVVKVLFGSTYLDCVPIFRVLGINYFIGGTFRTLAGNLLVTQRKLKFNLIVSVLSGCMSIVGNYVFINLWGSMGAAIATVLVTLVSGALNTIYLIHVFRNAITVAN